MMSSLNCKKAIRKRNKKKSNFQEKSFGRKEKVKIINSP